MAEAVCSNWSDHAVRGKVRGSHPPCLLGALLLLRHTARAKKHFRIAEQTTAATVSATGDAIRPPRMLLFLVEHPIVEEALALPTVNECLR